MKLSEVDMLILRAIYEFEAGHTAGSLQVKTLAAPMGLSLPTLMKHLNTLEGGGYVELLTTRRNESGVLLKSRGKAQMKQTLVKETIEVNDVRASISQFIKSNPKFNATMGELVFGSRLGEGGNSLVYSASTESGQSYAFKIVTEDCSTKETKRYRRFKNELDVISVLSRTTTHIAHIIEHGWVNVGRAKLPYVIMERYPYTLETWLRVHPIRDVSQLRLILESILACLATVHDANIVHRDLKPENILVAEDGSIVLADFGIAWFDSNSYKRLTQTSKDSLLGNRLFSAPEQMQRGATPKTTMDLFAVGQIIQWIVTGKTHQGVGRKQLATNNSDFAPLDEIVDQLLQNEPIKRPQHVSDVEIAVKRVFGQSRFERVSLVESGVANFDLSVYSNPPYGEHSKFGVPFQLRNARIAMTNIYATETICLNLTKPVSGAYTVHFLINAGDGRARYKGHEIGSINFLFEDDDTSHPPFPLILGQNVREWAIGNFVTDDDGKPEQLVDTVIDPNSREFWRGQTKDGQVAVIDMLAARVETPKRTKKLIGIEFRRNIPRNTIRLDYFISGITIEVGLAPSSVDQNASSVEQQQSTAAPTANGGQLQSQSDAEASQMRELITATREFNERLSQGMPGSSAQRYTRLKEQADIHRLMSAIARDCVAYELWTIQNTYGFVGMWSTDIIESIEDDIWLIKFFEAKIKEVWLHRDHNLEKQYVVLQLARMPSFGVEKPLAPGYTVAGYYQGRYIKRSEYDDGYALIDGQSVRVEGAELRGRYLKRSFIFLTPRPTHFVQNSPEAEDEFESVFKALEMSGRITAEILDPLRRIRRLPWMTRYD